MKFMQRKMKHFMTAWARLVGFGLPGVWASQLASLGGKETRAALVEPGAERSSETYVWGRQHCMLEAVNVCHQYNEL